jgi:hypothetical protein
MSSGIKNHELTVVIIDDNDEHLSLIARSLKRSADTTRPFKTLTYSSAGDALISLPPDGPIAILCDNHLGTTTGLDWLPDFVREDVGPVIIMTSQGDEHIATEAFHRGAADYIDKATVMEQPERVWHTIGEAMRRYRLDQNSRELSRNLKINNLQLESRNILLNEMTETAHRFVDNVAHDFRTPLTVIQEFASILTDGIGGELSEQHREFVSYIDSAARDLNQMVDDFLDTSKLKARTLRVDRRAIDPGKLLEGISPLLAKRAQTAEVQLQYEAEAGLPMVFCDEQKVRRILINLAVNAIKFSSKGQAVIIAAQANGNGDVVFSIKDHGPGIPEDQLNYLCERFRQVSDPRRICAEGFGLGLNIAQSLVWLNLGEMGVESTVGQGSTFRFTLPGCDPEHILHRYGKQLDKAETICDISLLKIEPLHPEVTAEQVRELLCEVCRSLDLLLPSFDGRCLIAMGPSESPDKWVERLQEAWRLHAPKHVAGSTLQVNWVGSWPARELPQRVVPLILQSLNEVRRSA